MLFIDTQRHGGGLLVSKTPPPSNLGGDPTPLLEICDGIPEQDRGPLRRFDVLLVCN